MSAEGLMIIMDKIDYLLHERMKAQALRINRAEVFSTRWIRICLRGSSPRSVFMQWEDEVLDQNCAWVHAAHATTEAGIAGISESNILKPGEGSKGFGPVVCAFASEVPQPYEPIASNPNYFKAMATVMKAADSSKHQCPIIVELMVACRKHVHRGSSSEARKLTKYWTAAVHYNSSHNSIWTIPAALSTPSALWVDMSKIAF